MRLLSVVQRYGVDVFGGAEQFARKMATQLVGRGHTMDVATSCARSYYDWANVYEPGTEIIEGVAVHRFAVKETRHHDRFNWLNLRMNSGARPTPAYMQRIWIHEQGPVLPGFEEWLGDKATEYDAVIFFNYQYWPSWAGMPMVAGRVPTILHPLAHDEPGLYLPIFDMTHQLPSGLAFLTEEECDLVRHRFGIRKPTAITGIGMDLEVGGDQSRFRSQYGLGDDPYIVSVGRIDPHKGSDELYDFFVAYKERNPGPLKLVVVGEPIKPLPEHADVVVTGFVEESVKDDAVDGALILVQPSYYESFSMVLTEAWAQYKPALVNGRSAVLNGQARRSNGAIPYSGFAEFETSLDMLLSDEQLRKALGRNGREYVERRYEWGVVLDRYERFLARLSE